MMTKKTLFTVITPLPLTVTRETATTFVHDHDTMIRLNPLVMRYQRTDPPANATMEEAAHCKFYLITDKISYIPGGPPRSEISYKAGFYDLPNGLQTHVFAPGGIDIRGLWKIGGNMPGEPREPQELGVDTPRDRLYLREDVDLRCSVFLTNFVKRNLKKAHAVMVDALLAKAAAEEERKLLISNPNPSPASSSVYSQPPSDCRSDPARISPPLSIYIPHYEAPSPVSAINTLDRMAVPHLFSDFQRADTLPSPIDLSPPAMTFTSHDQTQQRPSFPFSSKCICKAIHAQGCVFYPGLVLARTAQNTQEPQENLPLPRRSTGLSPAARRQKHSGHIFYEPNDLEGEMYWLSTGSDEEENYTTPRGYLHPAPLNVRRSYQGPSHRSYTG